MRLNDSVTVLSGVGPRLAAKLARLHIHTVADVLFHLPSRYEDRTKVTPIGALTINQSAVVVAQIESTQVIFGRRRSLMIRISDGTGILSMRFFYFSRTQQQALIRGKWLRCYGEVRVGATGRELIHPEYRVFTDKPHGGLEKSLTPIYPSTEGLSQALLRKIVSQALQFSLKPLTENTFFDVLPSKLYCIFNAIGLADAVSILHRPPPEMDGQKMQNARTSAHLRLIYEELVAHQLLARKNKTQNQSHRAIALKLDIETREAFLHQLGFALTQAQIRVAEEVLHDIAQNTPSLRLVQGDVGSGKTAVAAMAILAAACVSTQVAFMAPTELLAEQHYRTLCVWCEPLGFEVGLLTAKTVKSDREALLQALADGQLLIVVGTHALFQAAVQYKNLALVIIDEQHRFGVEQRFALRSKRVDEQIPHQILMTATPIPRTLAMSVYADMDVSSIDELPPGRKAVQTVLIESNSRRAQVIERIAVACESKRQVYWVCPLIEDSETVNAQAATETEQELRRALPGLKIGLIHGRLKTKEKESVMRQFRDAAIDILVATTVIEVGVDVPNANLMVIENAERLGLAQLHQLRGRVGRGQEAAFCLLLYQSPLSQHARQRLHIMRETSDGFVIAEKDLQIRGAGELLGTRQTGLPSFKIADLVRDQEFLPQVLEMAQVLEQQCPESIDALIARWLYTEKNYAQV